MNAPTTGCPLQYIRTINAIPFQDTFLIDEDAQIALNQTGVTKIAGCPENLVTTQYKNIFVAEKNSDHHHTLKPAELDIEVEIKNSATFSLQPEMKSG